MENRKVYERLINLMVTVMRNFINFKLLVFLLSHVCVAILLVFLEDKWPHSSLPVLCRIHQCQVMAGDTVHIALQG
jgi:hypothetical protein